MGEDTHCQEARRTLHKNGIPAFKNPQEAVRTFMNIYTRTQNLELLYQTPEEISLDIATPTHLKEVLRHAFSAGREFLNLSESLEFIAAYKIPILKTLIAKTAEESAALASQLGYPVVMKTLNPRYSQQNENQSAAFDVFSIQQLLFHFNQMFDQTKSIYQNKRLPRGSDSTKTAQCLLLPVFRFKKRPAVWFNNKFGNRRSFSRKRQRAKRWFSTVKSVLARQITENTKALQYCKDSSTDKFETGPIEEIIIKFSQLVVDFPEIRKVDINPIVVKDGKAYVVDAEIVLDLTRFLRQGAEHPENLVIAPYPKKYITQSTLKNGVNVTLRPIKPEDENRFNVLFKSLSPQSVRFRFFETIKEMSHDTLSRYCNLDYDREIAIVAQLDDSRLIGVVRLILDPEAKRGEFAIMVADSWHGLGLGSKLMDLIIIIGRDLKTRNYIQRRKPRKHKDDSPLWKQRVHIKITRRILNFYVPISATLNVQVI